MFQKWQLYDPHLVVLDEKHSWQQSHVTAGSIPPQSASIEVVNIRCGSQKACSNPSVILVSVSMSLESDCNRENVCGRLPDSVLLASDTLPMFVNNENSSGIVPNN